MKAYNFVDTLFYLQLCTDLYDIVLEFCVCCKALVVVVF